MMIDAAVVALPGAVPPTVHSGRMEVGLDNQGASLYSCLIQLGQRQNTYKVSIQWQRGSLPMWLDFAVAFREALTHLTAV
jgi:hypothetical protein